jgi:hypothetical protein
MGYSPGQQHAYGGWQTGAAVLQMQALITWGGDFASYYARLNFRMTLPVVTAPGSTSAGDFASSWADYSPIKRGLIGSSLTA